VPAEKQNKKGKSNVRNIVGLGLTSFFNDAASEMIYPLLPRFLAVTLGAGPTGLGLVEGIAKSTSSILKLFSGWLSDKLRKRKIIFFSGYLFSNILRPLIAFVTSWAHVLIIRFADRVGKGVRTAPRDALLADSASEKHKSFAFSFHRAMDHFGALVGPIIAWLLMDSFNFTHRKVFLFSVVPGVFVMLTIIFLVKEKIPKKRKDPDVEFKEQAAEKAFFEKGKPGKKLPKHFYYYLTIIIIFTLGNSADAFLLLLASEKGVPLELIPILWGLHSLSKMSFSFLGGWLGDRWSKKGSVILGWFIYGIVYLGFAFAFKTIHIWFLFASYGIYFGLTEGVEKAIVSVYSESENYGKAYGLYNLAIGIGALPASLIFGFLWQTFSYKIAFITGASLAVLASVILLFLPIKKIEKK